MPQVNTDIFDYYTTEMVSELFSTVHESVNTGNLFLSPFWLVSWLETLDKLPLLLICVRDKQVIGFGFWGKQTHFLGNTYFLNQTGNHLNDQVWTEHNDVICLKDERDIVVTAMLERLSALPNTSKIVIRNTLSSHWPCSIKASSERSVENSAYVDLTQGDYLQSLSKNTRSAIKRSNKLIENTLGEISVIPIDVASHPTILNEVGAIHIQRWGDSEFGSGFANPKFVAFHDKILKQGTGQENQAELLMVRAGDTCLGYLYVLKHGQYALFYLSAIKFSSNDNKIKPGMSMHLAAIEYYKKKGFERYDFLAGPARYKEQMSNAHYPVYHIEISMPSLRNRLFRWLKGFKSGT